MYFKGITDNYRPGQLFLQLPGRLVALVKERSLGLDKVIQAPHVVGLKKTE